MNNENGNSDGGQRPDFNTQRWNVLAEALRQGELRLHECGDNEKLREILTATVHQLTDAMTEVHIRQSNESARRQEVDLTREEQALIQDRIDSFAEMCDKLMVSIMHGHDIWYNEEAKDCGPIRLSMRKVILELTRLINELLN